MPRGKKLFFYAVMEAIALVVTAFSAELALRMLHKRPWVDSKDSPEPVIFKRDARLGWKPVEGVYHFPPQEVFLDGVTVTEWKGGYRATGPTPSQAKHTTLFVGCSFTQGWDVNDSDTYPWKIQEKLPDHRILNLGTAGYGTVQSLLRLQDFYREGGEAQEVVYGFLSFHERRNVADSGWLQTLANLRHQNNVAVPFATLDSNGDLLLHPPIRYPNWRLKRRSALVNLLERGYAEFARGRHKRDRAQITVKVVEAMKRVAESHGSHFAVLMLDEPSPKADEYLKAFEEKSISTIDCRRPEEPSDLFIDGHPRPKLYEAWANCFVTQHDQTFKNYRTIASHPVANPSVRR